MQDYRSIEGGQDPYKDLKPERIEKNKQDKDEGHPRRKRKGLEVFAKIFQLFKHMVTALKEIVGEQSSSSIEHSLKQNLEEMRKTLDDLKKMDCSQDMEYISHLSDLWHQFIEDISHFKRGSLILPITQDWIKELKSYPEKEEHSLGFYLEEYVGHKWHPFPYMKMLKDLHLEHRRDSENSKLNQWTKALTEIIDFINSLKKSKIP